MRICICYRKFWFFTSEPESGKSPLLLLEPMMLRLLAELWELALRGPP
jgi:hypothetical protein